MGKHFRYNFLTEMLGEEKEHILRFYTKKAKKKPMPKSSRTTVRTGYRKALRGVIKMVTVTFTFPSRLSRQPKLPTVRNLPLP